MSLTAWKKKYYPVEPTGDMSEREAIKHSLRKWQGLTPEILEEYELEKGKTRIFDFGDNDCKCFWVDNNSCALCMIYENDCELCPLPRTLAGNCTYGNSPYEIWAITGNAQPMIDALKRCLKKSR